LSFDAHQLDQILLIGAVVMLVAILAVRLSVRAGLPSLLVYLLMGVLLGESGLGIHFEDANIAHALGFAALVLILAEGGLTTHWQEIRPVMRLGVARREEPRDLDVEAAPLERIAADLLQIAITEKSLLHGVEVGELRLPVGASVSLVVRDGHTLVPEPRTVLRHGDEILVVTPRKLREATEDRLRAVSTRGRLAHWLDGPEPG
jgi:NhaP-type Na+/H+ and K+/H+ antiporter